ncbi:hypothetical protein LTR85_008416 [Meristemomyces frigidus]|nr:hypothetical protein LTR85_008416 [Meristemomyces frigidus]
MGSSGASIEAAKEPSIHLYAEHLQNIRTLSIQASLATPSNNETKAALSADGSKLTLTHDGETASIDLPISIPRGPKDATLAIPAAPSKELGFRLGTQKNDDLNADSAHVIPWMASDLTKETEIACAGCQDVLIKRGTIQQWKDLPSEGWAEMMDFWHCHKPDVPHDHGDHAEPGRGIGANSKLAVESGVGLVGPVDLLFASDDCPRLQPKSSLTCIVCVQIQEIHSVSGSQNGLLCPRCNTSVGSIDQATQGYHLRKPHLSVSSSSSAPAVSYGSERWLACHLLTAAENQGVRKLSVWTVDGNKAVYMMQLWLFATDLTVSSSVTRTPQPVGVVKVLFRQPKLVSEDAEHDGRPPAGKLNAAALTEGEVELETTEWWDLRRTLELSSALLPPKARKFQEWEVGLLRRFTAADIQSGS